MGLLASAFFCWQCYPLSCHLLPSHHIWFYSWDGLKGMRVGREALRCLRPTASRLISTNMLSKVPWLQHAC